MNLPHPPLPVLVVVSGVWSRGERGFATQQPRVQGLDLGQIWELMPTSDKARSSS